LEGHEKIKEKLQEEVIRQKTPVPRRNLKTKNSQSRILVVDDDESLRRLLVIALNRAGYRVESAHDGAEGWNALRAKKFDLLITDYTMPKLNGLELLRRVRNSPLKLPAVMMSAAMPLNVGEIVELVSPGGALHKPFAISQLLFTVGTILDLERSHAHDPAEADRNDAESASRGKRKTIQQGVSYRLNKIACKILMHESYFGSPGETSKPSLFKVCDKLRTRMQVLSGENGFRSFLCRALMLSRSEVVWLGTVNISAEGHFDGLRRAEAKLTRIEAIRGETVMIGHFLGLLFTFIGNQITRILLQDIWPDCITMAD
jgi:DNA-binding response OmpR family regulator